MPTGIDLVRQAEKTLGCRYYLGANVPMDDPNYRGVFDCAEKMTFDARWVTGKLYGCIDDSNWKDPEPFTGGWWMDVLSGRVIKVPTEVAAATPGSMLLRYGGGIKIGHIVMVSDRKNGTLEAMDSVHGVCRGVISGRRWTCGMLLLDVKYDQGELDHIYPPAVIYRVTSPYMSDPVIAHIQSLLDIRPDGVYGPATRKAVADFQRDHGLVVDGEAGPQTLKALGIN